MSHDKLKQALRGAVRCSAIPALALAICVAAGRNGQAQVITNQQAVGGVSINTEGVLNNSRPEESKMIVEVRRKAVIQFPGALNQPAKMRVISLRRMQEAIAAAQQSQQLIPFEIQYLAGLQRVQYVFVDPEHHDILLAGPADGWVVDALGDVVGRTNHQPVMYLDDLLVALRSADAARNGGVSCSINPTPEGIKRFQEFIRQQKTIGDPQRTLASIEESIGPQNITLQGVPGASRFASVMVAADFRMKRLAMNFEPAPVKGLPSYLEMIPAGPKVQNLMPRWWLAASYKPLVKDPDGLAWEIRGPGVKCMTEEDYITSTGQAKGTGHSNAAAQKWADLMTAKYDDLSERDTVFRQLRNCMDLSIVAALIQREHMADRADCRLDLLMNAKQLPIYDHPVPRQVPTSASFVKKGHNYLISASGGVQFQPWAVIQNPVTDSASTAVRGNAIQTAAESKDWWWN
jgi:hypothetical protein